MIETSINDNPDIIQISETKIKYINQSFKKLPFKMYDYTCDIKITVGKETFKAHKEVLENASDYFSAMFTHEMQEKDSNTIDIKDISELGFTAMIEYFYHGYITVDTESAEGILEAARFFHIEWLLDKVCRHYLVFHLSLVHFNLVIQLADLYFMNVAEVRDEIFDFFADTFDLLMARPIFLHLQFEALRDLLSDNTRCINASEYSIYKFVIMWLKSDQSRQTQASHLFRLIRFPLIELQQLDEILYSLETLPDELLSCDGSLFSELKDLVHSAIVFNETPYRQCLENRSDAEGRGSVQFLMLYSGVEDDNCINYKCAGGHGFLTESITTNFLDSVFEFASVVTLGNHLFVAGGYNRSNWCSSRAFYSYTPSVSKWVELSQMRDARVSFALCADEMQGLIFAIAGIDHVVQEGMDREITHSSVEAYDPRDNLWHDCAPLPSGKFYCTATSINGVIYVTGGISDDAKENVPVATTLMLNRPHSSSQLGEWLRLADMNVGRHSHCAVAANNKLFVFGGLKAKPEGDDTMGFVDCRQIEAYNLEADQWTLLNVESPLHSPHIYGCCPFLDTIFVVSGGTKEDMLLHEFDPETETLSSGEQCSGYIHKVVTLCVPMTTKFIRELYRPIEEC